jgi:GntR family transcriptional regulator
MTTTTKSGAGVSRYLRLYRVLSQTLAEGRFAAGRPLPSEPRLMRDYGISRSTVRRALARLEAEGRIERKRGSGTFARDRGGEAAGPGDLSPLLDGTAGEVSGVTCRTTSFDHIATPAFLLGEQPGFGDRAVLVRRLRFVAREPIALETAYLPQEVGGALTRAGLNAEVGPILTVLAALGRRSGSLEREFAALEADPLAADSLRLAVGAPVFSVCTLARDPQERIVAYVSCLYRPGRYEAHATVEIEHAKRGRAGRRG